MSLTVKVKQAGVPARYCEFTKAANSSERWSSAWEAVKPKLEIGKGSVIGLFGARGTGKTAMGALSVRYTCHQNQGQRKSAQYVVAADLFANIRSTYNERGATEDGIVRQMIEPELLVIDAIENKRDNDFEFTTLAHIVDSRYARLRNTILIGNNDWSSFSSALGMSTVDRIIETGVAIEFSWESFRSQKKG
jgi:DNA replication protein DnaC